MQTNSQPPEKQVRDGDGSVLAVNSLFATIQGEGPLVGTPAIFVRLAGCNLQCPLCDTEYSARELYSIKDLVWTVGHAAPSDHQRPRLVVITGGEPFRQPIAPFVDMLLVCGYTVQIETNGTLYQPLSFEHERLVVVCSPKAGHVNKKLLPHIKAFKYVGTKSSLSFKDGLPTTALEHPCSPVLFRPDQHHPAEIFLQPVDEQDAIANIENLRAVVDACRRFGYRLCLQVHKIIDLP